SPAGSQPGRSGRGRARASAYAMRSRTPGHSRANCARTPRQEDAGEVRDVQREGALRREGAPRGGVQPPLDSDEAASRPEDRQQKTSRQQQQQQQQQQ
ncbi:unnamed protein product, partial [Prorocentrum cordatum]